MGRRPKAIDTDPYYELVYSMNRNDLLTEYRKLAKRMNQRIVELAKHGIDMPKGEAFRWLEKEGRKRFIERIAKTTKTDTVLRNEILMMRRFEESKRTTMRGRKETEFKTRETISKKHMTGKELAVYEKLTSKRQKEKYLNQHGVSKDLASFTLEHINDLKDMMVWEYEKAVNAIMSEIKLKPSMSEDDLKKLIETAVNTRNERHFARMVNDNSKSSYKDFKTALTKVFGEKAKFIDWRR